MPMRRLQPSWRTEEPPMNKHITLIATNPPITVSWDDEAEAPTVAPLLTQGERFVCDQCGADITNSSLRIAVDGSHRHKLPRSFGLDQEHGCFSLAPGCALHRPLNLLLGKAGNGDWRPVSCATCGAAMGWYHQNEDGLGFFLITLENLRAADPEDETPDNDA